MEPVYLTDAQVMRILKCSRAKLWRLRNSPDEGFPPVIKFGGATRGPNLTRETDLISYLNRKHAEATERARQVRERERGREVPA